MLLAILALFSVALSFPFSKCGVGSYLSYETWDLAVKNNNPVVFPSSEAQLAGILQAAAAGGCKVRVRGSGHSANGLIAQTGETNVVVIHLSRLVTSDWANSIDPLNCVATISAGATFLDLIAMARPQGCVLITHTAFPFFTIGGVIANQVSGNGHGQGMLYDHVLAVRVMLASGQIVEYTNTDPDFKFFIGSYGLTGIILNVRYAMRNDVGVTMTVDYKEYEFYGPNVQAEMGQFFIDQATMQATNVGSECYMNPYPNPQTGKVGVTCYIEGASGIPFPSGSPEDQNKSALFSQIYQMYLQKYFALSYTGGYRAANITRACDIIPQPTCFSKVGSAAGSMFGQAQLLSQSWVQASSASFGGTEDGFFVPPEVLFPFQVFSYYVPEENVGMVLGGYLQIAGQAMAAGENAPWLPNTAFEWRSSMGGGKSAFDTLTPGARYLQIEIVNSDFALPAGRVGAASFMMALENVFRSAGGIPHAAKHYGVNPTGTPFQAPYPFYTPQQVAAVNAKLDEIDPTRLFSAGSSLFDFAPSDYVPFTEAVVPPPTCPGICAMYAGDPHLMRTVTACDKTTTNLPVQHCTNNHTNHIFAEGPTWKVFVEQDTSTFGEDKPSSVNTVVVLVGTELVYFTPYPASFWSTSVGPITVVMTTNTPTQTSVTVTIANSDAIIHIDRMMWVQGTEPKSVFSVNVCSAEITGGIAKDGCAPIDLIEITSGRRRLLTITEHPDCAGLSQPFRDNCNIDIEGLVDPAAINAVVSQSVLDEQNFATYVAESNLK